MKKTHLFALALVFMSLVGVSQNTAAKASVKSGNIEELFTPLKPADATPAVFTTRQEMEQKVPQKKQSTIDLIRQNKNNPAEVKRLREQLWRYENAITTEENK
ncbi:MAG TPA: hypothetical protein PLQ93_05800 [Bacteroidia bacterium]|nr:hypothetical protein [Bacteroidia bacterium]